MATKILHERGNPTKPEKPPTNRRNGITFRVNDPPRSMMTRDGLFPRVVWLPASVIENHDRMAGQLTELVTLAVSRFLRPGETEKGATVQEPPPSAITWTRTHSGNSVDLLQPDASDIRIEDIAVALSKLCRFAGHTSEFYSVAQHSVIVSRLCPPELRLKGLLHDAAEAFTADVPTPVKSILSPAARAEFKGIEARLMDAIGKAFGVDLSHDPAVKHADLVALRAEAELLLPEPIAGFVDLPGGKVQPIEPWRADVAEKNFLLEFRRLTKV